MSARFHDPNGERYGLPTYPWRQAPSHLRTKRQLAEQKLSPGEEYQAQVMFDSRYGTQRGYLYDANTAKPKRESSDAQLASLKIARWVRSADACERRGLDASDMRLVIAQARADLAARRHPREARPRERRRSR